MKNLRKQKRVIKRSVNILLILGLSISSVACKKYDDKKKDKKDKEVEKCVEKSGLGDASWVAETIIFTNASGETSDLIEDGAILSETRVFEVCAPKTGAFCGFESTITFPFSDDFTENGEYQLTKDLKILVYRTESGEEVFLDSSNFTINATCDEFTTVFPLGAEEGDIRTVSKFSRLQ